MAEGTCRLSRRALSLAAREPDELGVCCEAAMDMLTLSGVDGVRGRGGALSPCPPGNECDGTEANGLGAGRLAALGATEICVRKGNEDSKVENETEVCDTCCLCVSA